MSPPPPVPSRFQGAWQRLSLSLDGGPPGESAHVVWLQAAAAYADLRVPVAASGTGVHAGGPVREAMSFAGTTSWCSPHLTWVHELDSEPPGASPVAAGGVGDRGEVSWDGDDLVEAGTLVEGGRTVPYVETWRRLGRGDGSVVLALSTVDGTGRLVRVGDHAITVIDGRSQAVDHGGGFRAAYRVRRDRGWETVLGLGPGVQELASPPDGPVGGQRRLDLGGLNWVVLEAR